MLPEAVGRARQLSQPPTAPGDPPALPEPGGEQMDPYLHLTAQETKPVEIWDLLMLTQETCGRSGVKSCSLFWGVGNCDLDITTTVVLGRGFPYSHYGAVTVEVCFTGVCLCGSVYRG